MRIRSLFTALGINAIPAAGWYFAEWSAGTTLVLYWLETLIGTVLVAGRIVLHRRIRPSQGHWSYEGPKGHRAQIARRSTYLSAFFGPALIFIFVHGVFLAVLGGMMLTKGLAPEARIAPDHLFAGLIGIVVFQAIDLAADLIRLRTRPFRWIEREGDHSFGRVIVIQLTIMGGMCAVMFTGASRDFFGVFIFLKAMLNLSLALPQYNPETPPAWLSYLMDRIPSTSTRKDDGETFTQFWQKTDDDEEARIARNEAAFRGG